MLRAALAALTVFALQTPAHASDWVERYFGVGSGGDPAAACGEARDHAQGNSFKACVDRRGRRGEAAYTDCICAARGDQMHVCNVNLKVRCEVTAAVSGGSQSPAKRGAPKGRAGAIARRPALEVGR